jgi:hypothetical protein
MFFGIKKVLSVDDTTSIGFLVLFINTVCIFYI